MARAHFVKKARKAHEGGIKKGDSYWWWAFMVGGRGGPKHYSKTQPRASQLTQSAYYAAIADIQDDLAALSADDSLGDSISNIADRLNELADEQEEKKGNLPDSLQEAPSGELLQERADACRSAAGELEGINSDAGCKDEDESDDDYWQARLDEAQAVDISA